MLAYLRKGETSAGVAAGFVYQHRHGRYVAGTEPSRRFRRRRSPASYPRSSKPVLRRGRVRSHAYVRTLRDGALAASMGRASQGGDAAALTDHVSSIRWRVRPALRERPSFHLLLLGTDAAAGAAARLASSALGLLGTFGGNWPTGILVTGAFALMRFAFRLRALRTGQADDGHRATRQFRGECLSRPYSRVVGLSCSGSADVV
jgi:hypothetical protein